MITLSRSVRAKLSQAKLFSLPAVAASPTGFFSFLGLKAETLTLSVAGFFTAAVAADEDEDEDEAAAGLSVSFASLSARALRLSLSTCLGGQGDLFFAGMMG